MIEYVSAGNPDDRILAKAAGILGDGGIVAFPTDTSWSIACSVASKGGVRKLKQVGRGRDERHFTLLCADIAQIGELCSLDNTRFRLLKRLVPGPYVFVLKPLFGTEKALDIRRKELGVRIPDHLLPRALVRAAGQPLFSITAKRTMEEDQGKGSAEEDYLNIPEEELFDGGWELEDIPGIDLILDTGEDRPRLLSTVIDLTGDEVLVLRQGAGRAP